MSHVNDAPAAGGEMDLAPGEERLDGSGVAQGVRGYVIGLVLAAGLTAASFYVCFSGLIYGPAIPAALVALAVAQMGVHLVFFLHLTTGPDNTNNALALAFGVLIVTLVIGGSLWIMAHLNHNMAPMSQIMQMQR
jgi:cytochrome o ubiquinol oxidase operon protein cyoD